MAYHQRDAAMRRNYGLAEVARNRPKRSAIFHVLTIIIYRDCILRNTVSFCYCKLAIGKVPLR